MAESSHFSETETLESKEIPEVLTRNKLKKAGGKGKDCLPKVFGYRHIIFAPRMWRLSHPGIRSHTG